MNRIYEEFKSDAGLKSQALNNTNVTGNYFPMKDVLRLLAVLNGGAMAATKVSTIELLQATSAAGAGSKGIPTTVGQQAIATIAANTKVTRATIALATFLATGTITINGLVFTAHATVTTPALREFQIDGDDTADAAALAGLINNATYGVPGVTASSSVGVVTLISTIPGETVITVASSPDDATCVKATLEAQAFVEIENMDMDGAGDFTHIAVKVTTTANTVIGATLLRQMRDGSGTALYGAYGIVTN